eukprot:5598375-Prymnesium_polylepis.1
MWGGGCGASEEEEAGFVGGRKSTWRCEAGALWAGGECARRTGVIKAQMGSHGVAWGHMGSHGVTWGRTGSHGVTWGRMGSHG